MKKLLIIGILLLGISSLQAQNQFRLGLGAGLPLGEAAKAADFSVFLDAAYLFGITKNLDLGVATGYSHLFVGDATLDIAPTPIVVEGQDVQFIPVAAAGRFKITANFVIGADLGYGIGISDGNDGGFYYSPRAQYGISETVDIVVAFRGISDNGGSWDILTAGVEFGID